jgi:hypothetical protein
MATKTKYLSYIEETRKHHSIIEKVAKSSVKKAIETSHNKLVPVTYMEGEEIVKVNHLGVKSVVGVLKNNRRKVKKGDKTTISKK